MENAVARATCIFTSSSCPTIRENTSFQEYRKCRKAQDFDDNGCAYRFTGIGQVEAGGRKRLAKGKGEIAPLCVFHLLAMSIHRSSCWLATIMIAMLYGLHDVHG
jgi:hypothetical protein